MAGFYSVLFFQCDLFLVVFFVVGLFSLPVWFHPFLGIAALTLLPCQGLVQLCCWQSGSTLMASVCLPSFLVNAMLTSLPHGILPLSLHKWNRVSLLALMVWFSPILGMTVFTLLPPRVWLVPLVGRVGLHLPHQSGFVSPGLFCSYLTATQWSSSISLWAEQAHAY